MLSGLDIVKEAGGSNRALVKQFAGIEATDRIVLELTPAQGSKEPLVCGLEVVEQP